MPKTTAKPAKLAVRWSTRAQHSLAQTMAHIYAQDAATGRLVLQRVQTALDLTAIQLHIGTLQIAVSSAASRSLKQGTQ